MQRSHTALRFDPRTCPSCLKPRSALTFDRAPPSARSAFIRAKKTEDWYAKRLRAVAGHIAELLRGFGIVDVFGARKLQRDLKNYAEALTPWAEAVGGRMVAEVAQRDERSWQRVAGEMGRALKQEIATAPTGRVMREQLADQVRLITSLPVEAGQRVHDLTVKGISAGTRADAVADEIMRTGEVTKARATLIARTETSRTATLLTQSRAQHIGSTHFIWRTAGDSDVRATHRALSGQTFRWDDPPECDPGHHALPGAIWNCRCYPEPVIPD